MKNKYQKIIFLLAWFSVSQSQIIPSGISEVRYSSNIDYVNANPFSILHNQVMIDTIGIITGNASPEFIWEIRGARVDGYHKDADGIQYFSFDTDINIMGISHYKNSIGWVNGLNLSFYFSILPNENYNLNAFTLDPANGDVLFTIDVAAEIKPIGTVGADFIAFPSDIIRYNFTSSSYSIEARPYPNDPTKNIDALSLLPNGQFMYSLENDNVLNYLYFYNPATDTNTVAYTPLSFGDSYGNIDIMSLHATMIVVDEMFKDGFE